MSPLLFGREEHGQIDICPDAHPTDRLFTLQIPLNEALNDTYRRQRILLQLDFIVNDNRIRLATAISPQIAGKPPIKFRTCTNCFLG